MERRKSSGFGRTGLVRSEKIAFQGEEGAFSQVALQQLAGKNARAVPCSWFDEVFRRLESGEVHGAVIPIENTLHGSIHENYDHLRNFGLPIVAETYVRISHNLIVRPGTKFSQIKTVYSHPVALNQCMHFFAKNPGLGKEPFYDTAGSVKMLMESERTDAAAIASSIAADRYGATILKRGIEDDPCNFTRFFLLKKKPNKARLAGGEWKTSLVFTTANTAGSLFRSLSAFALRDISLTKIESRPLRGKPWEYLFYLDFVGHSEEPKVQKALGHLEELASFFRILGSYPKGSFEDNKGR
jgi:prephenate dehydratase